MRRVLLLGIYSLTVWGKVRGIDSVGMTVSDLDRSVEFYTHVLTFSKVSDSCEA